MMEVKIVANSGCVLGGKGNEKALGSYKCHK